MDIPFSTDKVTWAKFSDDKGQAQELKCSWSFGSNLKPAINIKLSRQWSIVLIIPGVAISYKRNERRDICEGLG